MLKGTGFKNGNLEEGGGVHSAEKLEDFLVLFLNKRCDTGEGNHVNVGDHVHLSRASL